MAVTTTPIVRIDGTEAALRAGLGSGQMSLASDTKKIIWNTGGTIVVFSPQFIGLTLQDVEAASVVANVEFQGDGGSLSGLVGENITCLTSITGLTASNLSLALAELKGLVTALTTAGYLTVANSIKRGYIARTATAATGATDDVVNFTGSTASQIETIPDAAALVGGLGRVITYKNSATVSWTLRMPASNTLDGSAADVVLPVGASITIQEIADNTWVVI
jgi:hypothetical protein